MKDSIPWDISAMELQSKLVQEQSDTAQSLSFWDELKGGAPGGTFATVIANVEGKAIEAPRVDFDPFLRLPDGSKSSNVCKANLSWLPAKFRSTKQWTSPFVMAMVNSQVVRWSYALRSATGPSTMTYTESQLHPNFATAMVNYAGLAMFGSMLLNPLTLYLTKTYLIPKPGEGPSMVAMETKRTWTVSVFPLPPLQYFLSKRLLSLLIHQNTQTFYVSRGKRSAGMGVARNLYFI
jgi:short subunit dehydrogenase-like uncharacterized protein